MNRNVIVVLVILGLLTIVPLWARDSLLTRFFPPKPVRSALPALSIPPLPPLPQEEKADVRDHNRGVRLNNEGIDLMEKGNFQLAVARFSEACETDPQEKAFQNNLLVAMKKGNQRPGDIIAVGRKLMAMIPGDFQPPLTVGVTLMEKLNKPLEALPYLELARQKNPHDSQVVLTNALAYEKAGYPDQAIELLKACVSTIKDDPYPGYLLGKMLVDRGDLAAAIRAFKEALPKDSEGYVHDMYLRTRYYAGQLDGLGPLCGQALTRFPGIINRKSLERIYQALIPQRVRFQESVTVLIEDPPSLRKLDFLISIPPTVPGKQTVVLKKAEIVSPIGAVPVPQGVPDQKGRTRFTCPPEHFNKTITLALEYEINTYPLLFKSFSQGKDGAPDLASLKTDEKLSLNNPDLEAIFSHLSGLEGDWLENCFTAVARGLKYAENFQYYPVSWALANPDKCDCTEYASLFAALCLKKDIPARVMTGFLLKPELENKETEIGHAWTEVYLRDKGWVSYDPTLGSTLQMAYFGNKLSDQIIFRSQEPGSESRTGIDFTSERPLMDVKLSSHFKYTLLKDR